MKKALLLFCLFWLAFASQAQEAEFPEAELAPDLFRNSVFLELGGNAGIVSLNYERLIPLKAPGKNLVLRIGGIAAPDGWSYALIVPVEVSLLMGQKAVKLELGLGQTWHQYGSWGPNAASRPRFNYAEVLPVLRIGGRWQKPGKHWFVKVAATPFLERFYTDIHFPFSPWAGISIGYNFDK